MSGAQIGALVAACVLALDVLIVAFVALAKPLRHELDVSARRGLRASLVRRILPLPRRADTTDVGTPPHHEET